MAFYALPVRSQPDVGRARAKFRRGNDVQAISRISRPAGTRRSSRVEAGYVDYDPQIPRANALNQFVDPAIEAALLQLQTPAGRHARRRPAHRSTAGAPVVSEYLYVKHRRCTRRSANPCPYSSRRRAFRRDRLGCSRCRTSCSFSVFLLAPTIFGFWISLHRWHVLATTHPFIGLSNYGAALSDDIFYLALRNTAYFVLLVVPAGNAVSLLLALGLSQIRRFRAVYHHRLLPAGRHLDRGRRDFVAVALQHRDRTAQSVS